MVNVEPDPRQDLSTLALVGGAGRYNQDDIIARFADETATPEERTSERIRRAEAIVEQDPDRAWEIASQTVAEMGAPDVPNGVSDREVRRDARATLMRTLALLLAAGEGREENVHLRRSLQVGVDMDAETEEEIPDEGVHPGERRGVDIHSVSPVRVRSRGPLRLSFRCFPLLLLLWLLVRLHLLAHQAQRFGADFAHTHPVVLLVQLFRLVRGPAEQPLVVECEPAQFRVRVGPFLVQVPPDVGILALRPGGPPIPLHPAGDEPDRNHGARDERGPARVQLRRHDRVLLDVRRQRGRRDPRSRDHRRLTAPDSGRMPAHYERPAARISFVPSKVQPRSPRRGQRSRLQPTWKRAGR